MLVGIVDKLQWCRNGWRLGQLTILGVRTNMGEMNQGALKLRKILDSKDRGAYRDFAITIGAGLDMVSKWLAAKHRPSLAYRVKIADLHGIDILEWDVDVSDDPVDSEQ